MKDQGEQLSFPKPEYGSDVITHLLRDLEIDYLALNPGATFRELHDSIVNYGGNQKPQIILCCHEEIAVSLAHGYNKAAAKPMAAIVHDLVGLLHGTMAIYNAWVDRAPVLILGATGPMAVDERRPWIDWIHTAVGQGDVVKDYVKWADQVVDLPSAIDSILRGYQIAMTEPKGPVYVCLDVGLQKEKLRGSVAIPNVDRYAPPSPVQGAPDALRKVAELLVEAEHPVVVADHLGTKPKAIDALIELAELLSLPVLDNGNMFSFPNTHPLDLTGAEMDLLGEADLILSLDVFDLFQSLTTSDRTTRETKYLIPHTAKLVDISLRHFAVGSWSQDYGKLQPMDVALSSDITLALPALTSLCRDLLAQRPEKSNSVQERFDRLKARHDELRRCWKGQAEAVKNEKPISLPCLAAELWEVVREEDWVLTNRALNGWSRRLWDWTKPYQYGGGKMGGALGIGIGHSLGVALAHRPLNRLCIDIQADGDLLYTPSGLWTAAHHHIPLLVIMFNNRSYYNSEDHQGRTAKMRGRSVENKVVGTRLDNPSVDFARLAQSFGLYGEGPIENPEELRPALQRAVSYIKEKGEAALVDVVTQPR